jgi:phosphatidylglycerol---prolipoprotein diacylglyceryl transferase
MEFTQFGIEIGGSFVLRYYGIILMVGAVAGAFLASRLAVKRNINPELVWDGLVWVLIFGIIGARLWHVLTPSPSITESGITTLYYFQHPLELINVRAGGLGIYGAIIGGILGLWIFSKRRRLDFLQFADIAVPGLALGQAIGRFANYVNGELCGVPTDLPWGIARCFDTGFPEGTRYHPVFFYEMIWSLLNMAFLLLIFYKYSERLKPGDMVLVYFSVYSLGRFLIEFIRLDSSLIGLLNANQTFALVVFLISIFLLAYRHRKSLKVIDS